MKKQTILQLSDIACCLPYGLKVQSKEDGKIFILCGLNSETDIIRMKSQNFTWSESIHAIQPLLRPMSDLYKPCLEDGKIPIVELAKLEISGSRRYGTPQFGYEVCENAWGQKWLKYNPYLMHGAFGFSFCHISKSFKKHECRDDKACEVSDQYLLFQKICEWHFDINGLIERKLAIDINTIKI